MALRRGQPAKRRRTKGQDLAEVDDNQRGPINKWANAPARKCKQCLQTTHDIDRDSTPEQRQFVLWSKSGTTKTGCLYPTGEECYRCFDVRRRYFPELARVDLTKERRASRAVDDRFTELRADKVRGEKKFHKDEAVDVKRLAEKKKSTFDERYEEGTFYELRAYARKCGLDDFADDSDLIQHLQDKFGLQVREDADGTLGVEVVDQDASQYRFKRGRRAEASTIKRESYTDKRTEAERVSDWASQMPGGGNSMTAHLGAARAPAPKIFRLGGLRRDIHLRQPHAGSRPGAQDRPQPRRLRPCGR